MTEDYFYASNPVFSVDGEDVGELARDLVHLQVDDSVDGLKVLRARFVAIGPMPGSDSETLLYLDGTHVDFGKSLKVCIGPPSNQRIIFDGVISALEINFDEAEEPEFCLYAEDGLMDMRMTRRSKTYENMSDADIARELAGEHGLADEISVEGPVYDRIQQFNMSDLAFLRERARLLQAEIWISEGALHMQTRDHRQGTELTLIRGTDLISVKAVADLAHQRTSVRCSGYDAVNRSVIDESADQAAIDGEITGGRSGVEILQTAMGERISHRVREVPLDATEATDWAHAEMLRRARSFVRVNAVSRGTPDLIVGSLLSLEQVGVPFSGSDYYVTQVNHTFDLSDGHRTYFEAERATVST